MNNSETQWIENHIEKSVKNVIELMGDENLIGRKLRRSEVLTGVVWTRGKAYGTKIEHLAIGKDAIRIAKEMGRINALKTFMSQFN